MAHAQEYGIRNPIIEIDIADTSIDWETFNITKLVEMVVFLLTWTQENLYTGKGGAPVPEGEPRPRSMVRTRPKRAPAEVVRGLTQGPTQVNIRDFPVAMISCPARVEAFVSALARLPVAIRPIALLYEEPVHSPSASSGPARQLSSAAGIMQPLMR